MKTIMEKRKVSFREFLHACNILAIDEDVNVDGLDSIALVAGELSLTPAGEKHFSKALDRCFVESGSYTIEWNDDEEYEDGDDEVPKIANLANDLLLAFAGYCTERHYQEWFEGTDAKLI